MPQRRKPSYFHIPEYEDAGLFKKPVGRIRVALAPVMHSNLRQDLIVLGVLREGHEVDVVFAGRRAKQTGQLRQRLHQLRQKMQADAKQERDGAQHGTKSGANRLLLPVQIEGAWRPKFLRDTTGCETRAYQLIVARWTLITESGDVDVSGMLPKRAGKTQFS